MCVVRLIQKKTGHAFSSGKLIEAMNKISCSHEVGNFYLVDPRSETSDVFVKAFDIDFTKVTGIELNAVRLPPP